MNLPTVYIVDDDAGVRESLGTLLEIAGMRVSPHASAEAFLAACGPEPVGCMVLDVRMPGMDGLALQAELARQGIRLPIIFLTAYADIPMTVEAMRGGAADFLTKPVNGAAFVERVKAVLERHIELRDAEANRRQFQQRLEKLTAREREVLNLALAGKQNKEIALLLHISHRTIEAHRSRIFLKTGVNSLLELARLASAAGIEFANAAGWPEADDRTS